DGRPLVSGQQLARELPRGGQIGVLFRGWHNRVVREVLAGRTADIIPSESHGPMNRRQSWRGVRVFTVGHSTRSLDDLVELLRAFAITTLADIRTVPRSRHNPQFNRDALHASLRARRLRYVHVAELGGLRKPRKDSANTGWRNDSFRGFADYMASDEFEAGI